MPNIPLGDVLEGIRRCHENARALLDAAENVLSGAHPAYALALYSFALEELGKATLLRDAPRSRRCPRASLRSLTAVATGATTA
jgi:AbiV family abortive infection protein